MIPRSFSPPFHKFVCDLICPIIDMRGFAESKDARKRDKIFDKCPFMQREGRFAYFPGGFG